MPTQLDQDMDRLITGLTAPGMPFETDTIERHGTQLPVFKNAPPTLAHYFAHFCTEHADLEFLVDGDIRLTFGETFAAARHVAAGLVQRHDVRVGDRVGIAARNSANWIISYMGIILAGGCATLVNGFWTGAEMAYGIKLAECSLVLADSGRAKRLEGEDFGAKLVVIGHDGPPTAENGGAGLSSIWPEHGVGDMTLPDIGPDDMATILYTSGSTGYPKGAVSDHRAVVHGAMSYMSQSAMAKMLLTEQGNEPKDQPCALIAVPLFHVTGEVPLYLQSYGIARKLVLMPKWDAREAMRLMEAEKVSYFVGVPLMSYEIASHPERGDFDLTACKSFAAGGAPRPVEHVTKIKEAFPEGFPLLGYGLTETNGVGCGNFNENYMAKPGSTGKASKPIVEIAILDDDGNHLAQGDVGEVCFRTVANFAEYYKNPEATKAAYTDDGFFRTGDLGYLDEDEYLFIVDRKKDIIIRGGENISCIEVEQEIYAHPDVKECSCFGLDDERFGELPAVVFHVKEGSELTPEALRGFLEGRLAPFKMPTRLWKSDETLPRLGTQKIDKRTVKDAYKNNQTGAV